MKNKEKILELLKNNNGYVTSSMVKNEGIDLKFLSNMVKDKQLTRISRGTYRSYDDFPDVFYEHLSKSKYARYSHTTALYFHNYSMRTPIHFDITIKSGYGGALQKEKNISLFYVKKSFIDLGLIEVLSPFGMPIKIYDLERTICDIVRDKNKIDPEIFTEAIKQYARHKPKNMAKLLDYAKKLKIERKLRDYLEVLV
ncbi:MAG: type IV toxin-antitoxin system AbiEi family antitoxin domain-containing protein [Oscillospiraceae bacterium]|nr:type IV toxin-antitoxin system AbiEi family antitoxin domain-containing protein [Oscillospiraceae bacterium]